MAALVLGLAEEKDISLRADRTVFPIHPAHTTAPGVVVVELEFDPADEMLTTRALHSQSPFGPPALDALTQWRFSAPKGAATSRTSVTFLFQPSARYSPTPIEPAVMPWKRGADTAALPQKVIDPGYPVAPAAAGAVIFAVRIDALGLVTGIETVQGIEALAKQAAKAVRNWKFSPAIISAEPAPSTAYVVISFAPPTWTQ